ncbi:hypothetical protein TNCV_286701 [Trichonephila clavipes]|nr:hypothetical protein TNCV_286701 [Trichonephila clavipes]
MSFYSPISPRLCQVPYDFNNLRLHPSGREIHPKWEEIFSSPLRSVTDPFDHHFDKTSDPYCDTLFEIGRGDSENVTWASQIWRSVVGYQCETTLGEDNAKPYCNTCLGARSTSVSLDLAPRDFYLILALKMISPEGALEAKSL